jgi:hypothetical protein
MTDENPRDAVRPPADGRDRPYATPSVVELPRRQTTSVAETPERATRPTP